MTQNESPSNLAHILILVGSKSDVAVTQAGLDLLREFGAGFSLRIASAHRTPAHLHAILHEFNHHDEMKAVICVAGKSAHLAGVVASHTLKPVLAVPLASQDPCETAGFDALLSMVQMPNGIPVATFGFGRTGFSNAVLFALALVAMHDQPLFNLLRDWRTRMADTVMGDDAKLRIDFEP